MPGIYHPFIPPPKKAVVQPIFTRRTVADQVDRNLAAVAAVNPRNPGVSAAVAGASQNTGPATQPRYGSTTSTAPAPNDPLSGVSQSAQDEASTLIDQFAKSLGWPHGMDLKQMKIDLLTKAGATVTQSPEKVFSWLFGNELSATQQQQSPWAELGMMPDDYHLAADKINSVYFDMSGDRIDPATLKRAIYDNWLPTEVQNFLLFGDPAGSTDPAVVAAANKNADVKDMPWLAGGSTYLQTYQGYTTQVGQAPADKKTLAAWYRFGTSAKQVSSTAPAQEQARPLTGGTEVR